MKLAAASSSLLAMSSAVAAFSSITRSHFRSGISNHAARNVASIFTATAYMVPPTAKSVYASFGKSSSFRVTRRNNNDSSLKMADDSNRPFNTWSFDNACDTMEFNRIATASLTATGDMTKVDDSDLIILGIYGPSKESEDEEEEENDDKDKEVPQPELVGKAKQLDDELGGAITEIMMENYKAFKHGGKAGGTTPTLRIASIGSKVRHLTKCIRVILL